jgi:hypothetical protein
LCTELTTIGTSMEETDASRAQTAERDRKAEYDRKIAQFLDKARASQKSFIQNAPCFMIDPSLPPCHECKKIQVQSAYAQSGTCCCFEGFRKLRYTEKGQLLLAGYMEPTEAKAQDMEIWTPDISHLPKDLTDEVAFLIVKKTGDLLCNMILDEKSLRAHFQAGLWIRNHFIRIRIQHFWLNTNPDPDPIRIQGFND